MKRLSLMIHLLSLGSLLITLMWYMHNSEEDHHRLQPKVKGVPRSCKNCGEDITKVLEIYSQTWQKQESNSQNLRSLLKSQCNGVDKAIITQTNTPLGTKIVYDGERKRTLEVNSELFNIFLKGCPFANKTLHTCSVVGNGGILQNSYCGKKIDSAEFVIRCNLPPLSYEFVPDVGTKTNLVTGNPTIFLQKYGSLNGRRRPLIEHLRRYGDSMLLLSAFSFGMGTEVCLRTLYTIEDFESPIRPVFYNPEYLHHLNLFWRSRGLKEYRLSTGMMMVSLALELCENVDVYGFWPFSVHPFNFQDLTNHYYDDKKPGTFHSMPSEFNTLLQLHRDGVIKLHLGDCEAEGS